MTKDDFHQSLRDCPAFLLEGKEVTFYLASADPSSHRWPAEAVERVETAITNTRRLLALMESCNANADLASPWRPATEPIPDHWGAAEVEEAVRLVDETIIQMGRNTNTQSNWETLASELLIRTTYCQTHYPLIHAEGERAKRFVDVAKQAVVAWTHHIDHLLSYLLGVREHGKSHYNAEAEEVRALQSLLKTIPKGSRFAWFDAAVERAGDLCCFQRDDAALPAPLKGLPATMAYSHGPAVLLPYPQLVEMERAQRREAAQAYAKFGSDTRRTARKMEKDYPALTEAAKTLMRFTGMEMEGAQAIVAAWGVSLYETPAPHTSLPARIYQWWRDMPSRKQEKP